MCHKSASPPRLFSPLGIGNGMDGEDSVPILCIIKGNKRKLVVTTRPRSCCFTAMKLLRNGNQPAASTRSDSSLKVNPTSGNGLR